MSAFDPKQTWAVAPHMSAFGVIADIGSRPVTSSSVAGLFMLAAGALPHGRPFETINEILHSGPILPIR
jgi:hypothetical protein